MQNQPQTQQLETEIITVDPRDLYLLERNARFMPERQFKTLVDNLRRDGCLTSLPLVIMDGGRLKVLSGNHRTKASIAAGLATIQVMKIVGELPAERQVAIQLAQNALVGQDDPNLLRELYESLDVLEQRYTGITDTDLGLLQDPDLEKLRIGMPKYEEVLLSFLPEDKQEFLAQFEKLAERAKKAKVIHARYADYEAFFGTLIRTKDVLDITNDAIAIGALIELATERLDQIEGEQAKAEADAKPSKREAA